MHTYYFDNREQLWENKMYFFQITQITHCDFPSASKQKMNYSAEIGIIWYNNYITTQFDYIHPVLKDFYKVVLIESDPVTATLLPRSEM